MTVITASTLATQTIESRFLNIGIEVDRQLELQFGISGLSGNEAVEMILKQIQDVIDAQPRRSGVDPYTRKPREVPPPPKAEQILTGIIERVFPHTKGKAISLIRGAVTVDRLISHINVEAGV